MICVPFYATFSVSFRLVATANICNVVLMRNHELFTGIEVKDKDGNVVGTSKIASRKVHKLTINVGKQYNMRRFSRFVLSILLFYWAYLGWKA